MKLIVDIEDEFIPSKEYFLDSVDKKKKYGVVFEVDEETAYFYAVKMIKGTPNTDGILDACHIYNVKDLKDGNTISTIKIDWSDNYKYALLFINEYVHAIFDFKHKQGYCRTGFPKLENKESGWSKKNKLLDEKLLEQFRQNK
ncbi:MAG: DUF2251 domain-containing protein [Treponema sp.]|nr:DUF2251 domain-containing protein [Treponema sp.]